MSPNFPDEIWFKYWITKVKQFKLMIRFCRESWAGSLNHFSGEPDRGEPTFHQWEHSILWNAALWLAEIRLTPIWLTTKMI